ncbi:MAG: exodeoxyribonuclease VII large subunit [Paludibacteraceae bacterium]|nr:exodeoxyribonuclease VII large subunit [Paludibacteraceae bacterium]
MAEIQAYTLTQLNSMVGEAIEASFPEAMWVKAEISEFRVNGNGHAYFELIDKTGETITAKSKAACWRNLVPYITAKFLEATGSELKSGIKVLLQCGVSFHPVFGFSLVVNDIDPSYTLGDMARERQEIVNRLKESGVFDLNRELPFPEFPQRVAVISSATAAGYGDFMNQLQSSGYAIYPRLFQATMQGDRTAQSVIAALDRVNEHFDKFDVVVIIRGGGATSDMAGFESYELAECVCNFPLPVVTGIGHQRDTCVLDLVANQPVKTPTAVAELLISAFDAKMDEIARLCGELRLWTTKKLSPAAIAPLAAELKRVAFAKTAQQRTELRSLVEKMRSGSAKNISDKKHAVDLTEQLLKFTSPLEIMKRGFAMVTKDGKRVRSAKSLKSGDRISLQMIDGSVEAETK